MLGDVGQINTYGDTSENGKGLYIYHVPNGIYFPCDLCDISPQDMECADGLFQWTYTGQSAQQVIFDCFISGSNAWPYYVKTNVIYDNDYSTLGSSYGKGDGISFHNYRNSTYDVKWWSEGEKPTHNCSIGTDRIFTHKKEIYTSFEIGGDRWDAWKPGYNEVFSPYSSPNTKTWANENSGIFIWYYEDLSSPPNTARMKIYKVGESGLSQDSILRWTPPSRPMGLEVVECDSQPTINGYKRIKLTWNHNMEPDMLPVINDGNKKYKIYRNTGENMTDALQYSENYYSLIATVYINESVQPSYIDSTTISGCTEPPREAPPYWVSYPIRYRVQAVDHYNTSSVLSDFASTTGWFLDEGGIEDGDNRPIASVNAPKEYSLKQNYPNPFNPSTTIRYELPFDGNVSIKIYDITGRIIMTLVNENKTAGRYEITFDGQNFASGIYYYKIESGNFSQVRKMIMIK